jgi:predicted component of type VI protein secretion system
MTVATQLKQTLASLKGAESTIKTYALHHPNQYTREQFRECESTIKEITNHFQNRIQEVEFEEPQFKGL